MMRWVEGQGQGACTICWQACPTGYVDAGPVDIVCEKCAKEIQRVMNEREQQKEQSNGKGKKRVNS